MVIPGVCRVPRIAAVDSFYEAHQSTWSDKPNLKLEGQIAEIATRLIVAWDSWYRRSLRLEEERLADLRQQAIFENEARRRKRDQERVEALNLSGELLLKAANIRQLVERVRSEIENGDLDVANSDVLEWALGHRLCRQD